LVQDGRMTTTEIAQRVSLTVAPVKRRIDRLEREGVISGYTAIVNRELMGVGFEAFVELRFAGNIDVESVITAAQSLPEVVEAFTVAGDPDSLVRIRVNDVHHLQRVVNALRRNNDVTGTKTLMVLGSWRRSGASPPVSSEKGAI